MILLTNQYLSEDPARAAEIAAARVANQANAQFTKVVLFCGDFTGSFTAKLKVIIGPDGDRPTYDAMISFTQTLPQGSVCVIANADISFEDTLSLAESIATGQLYALSRYDATGRVAPMTADAWVFRTPFPLVGADFALAAATNSHLRFAGLCRAAGVTVTNPSLSIHLTHHHASGVRTYAPGSYLPGALCYPAPSYLPGTEPPPESVSAGQMHEWAIRAGQVDAIAAAIAAIPDATDRAVYAAWWEKAPEFHRANPKIAAISAALGLTNAQVDEVFRVAAAY